MADYFLAAYTVKVRPRFTHATGTPVDLSDFDDAGSDLLPYILAFCNTIAVQPVRDKEQEKFLRTMSVQPDGRIIRTEMEAGSHGFTSRMFDVEENRETYQRRHADAELLPIRSVFIMPSRSPIGLFITERVGVRGLKGTLVKSLTKSFNAAFPGFTIDFSPLAPEAAVKASLEDGNVKGLRLIKYGIPRHLEERYNLGSHQQEVGTLEVYFRPQRGVPFPKQSLTRLLESDSRAGLLEFGDVLYNDIKVEVKVGKQIRTVSLQADQAPRISFPVPEDIETDTSGRPLDPALYQFAAEISSAICLEIGIDYQAVCSTKFSWTPSMLAKTVEVIINES